MASIVLKYGNFMVPLFIPITQPKRYINVAKMACKKEFRVIAVNELMLFCGKFCKSN